MKEYIIDTSVAVKWFTKEKNDFENAFRLRQQLLDRICSITVPDLLVYELANALKHNPNFTDKNVISALSSIFMMGLNIKIVDNFIIEKAIYIAYKYNVTVYDSYFLAISQIENKPLITADYKFFSRVKDFKNLVILSELDSASSAE